VLNGGAIHLVLVDDDRRVRLGRLPLGLVRKSRGD
jgi:hypothetical protein